MKINTNRLTVGELLNDKKNYAVPLFQRSFSWGKDQITDFWDDLIDIYKNKDDDYFMGSMVFTPYENRNKIKILDGQQRFAISLLFLAAIRDVLKNTIIEGSSDWIDEINRVIFMRNFVTRQKNSKLELNREDKTFFEKVVIEGIIPDIKYKSHKLISECYIFFKNQIKEKVDTENKIFIEGVLDVILNKFLIIKIEVDSDINAHMIFETLNDRGLDLSVADLFKNYVFSISGSNLDDVSQLWMEMVDQATDHNVTRFLRHYCNSKFEFTRKEGLYKKLKNIFNERNVKSLIEELNKEAEIYANLNNPTNEFWNDREIVDNIEELNTLKVEQAYTLLLSSYVKYYESNKNNFKKMLNLLINFTFKYSTVSRLNPNELEKTYSSLAIKLRKGKINFNIILQELKKLSPPKDYFFESFKNMEIKNSKLAKYILFKINNHLLLKEGKKEITTNINRVNLEHIIPKNPDKEWKKFFREKNTDESQLIHKLGNMTVLLKEYNRKLKNKFIDKKKEMYKKSDLPLNQKLKDYKEFGDNEVQERQSEMAKISESLWDL